MAGASRPSETASLLAPSHVQAEEGRVQSHRDSYSTNYSTDYSTSAETSLKQTPPLSTTWQFECHLLIQYSTPLLFTYLLQYSFNLVTVYVAGQLGTNELGAASLASMTANITGLCIYEGLATSLDTLTSQAFGSGQKLLVGLHVQRMITFLLLVTIPIGVMWMCSPYILEALIPSQEREVAHLAGHFLRIYLLGAPGYAIFEAGKRFTQAQGSFTPSLAVLVVVAPLNILLNDLLVFRCHLGFTGAALAVSISNLLLPVFFLLYISLFARHTLQCWPTPSAPQILTNWRPMLHLSLPGVLMVFCEWLAFDILTFSASYLSTAHLAAQSVLMTVSVSMYHIPLPIAIAASTRFGHLIGMGHPALPAARIAFRTHYAVFVLIGLGDIALLTALRDVIPRTFTTDPAVRQLITSVIPVVAAAQFFDATTCLSNALLRGLGRQRVGGWVNLAAYYAFAVPLSLYLTFGPAHMGLVGLWIGPVLGLVACTAGVGGYLCVTAWEGAVDEARERGD